MPALAITLRTVVLSIVLVLSLNVSVHAQETTLLLPLRINEGVFTGLQVLDLRSTHVAERNGAVEANPLMRTSLGTRITLKAAGTAAVLAFAEGYKRKHPWFVMWTLTALNAGYAVVVTRNYHAQRNTQAAPHR
jgi:hypothetical protein